MDDTFDDDDDSLLVSPAANGDFNYGGVCGFEEEEEEEEEFDSSELVVVAERQFENEVHPSLADSAVNDTAKNNNDEDEDNSPTHSSSSSINTPKKATINYASAMEELEHLIPSAMKQVYRRSSVGLTVQRPHSQRQSMENDCFKEEEEENVAGKNMDRSIGDWLHETNESENKDFHSRQNEPDETTSPSKQLALNTSNQSPLAAASTSSSPDSQLAIALTDNTASSVFRHPCIRQDNTTTIVVDDEDDDLELKLGHPINESFNDSMEMDANGKMTRVNDGDISMEVENDLYGRYLDGEDCVDDVEVPAEAVVEEVVANDIFLLEENVDEYDNYSINNSKESVYQDNNDVGVEKEVEDEAATADDNDESFDVLGDMPSYGGVMYTYQPLVKELAVEETREVPLVLGVGVGNEEVDGGEQSSNNNSLGEETTEDANAERIHCDELEKDAGAGDENNSFGVESTIKDDVNNETGYNEPEDFNADAVSNGVDTLADEALVSAANNVAADPYVATEEVCGLSSEEYDDRAEGCCTTEKKTSFTFNRDPVAKDVAIDAINNDTFESLLESDPVKVNPSERSDANVPESLGNGASMLNMMSETVSPIAKSSSPHNCDDPNARNGDEIPIETTDHLPSILDTSPISDSSSPHCYHPSSTEQLTTGAKVETTHVSIKQESITEAAAVETSSTSTQNISNSMKCGNATGSIFDVLSQPTNSTEVTFEVITAGAYFAEAAPSDVQSEIHVQDESFEEDPKMPANYDPQYDTGSKDDKMRTSLDDLTSYQNTFNTSSTAFLERLRGAAETRRREVTRCRYSLERKEQLVMEEKEVRATMPMPTVNEDTRESPPDRPKTKIDEACPYTAFNARPKPSTTVERRGLSHRASSANANPPKKAETSLPRKSLPAGENPYKQFRARPLPGTTRAPTGPALGSKRKSSTALKPPPSQNKSTVKASALNAKPPKRLLSGEDASIAKEMSTKKRLQEEEAKLRRDSVFKARPLPATTLSKSKPFAAGEQIVGKENYANCSVQPFTPHSSVRAKERAHFDKARAEREKSNREDQRRRRHEVIDNTMAEIDELKERIR